MPKSAGNRKKVNEGTQLRPLIVSAARSRVSETVTMSAATSRELAAYVRWASKAAGLSIGEALTMTVDRSIGDFLKRDEAWQQAKGEQGGDLVSAQPSPPPGPTSPPHPSNGAGAATPASSAGARTP
jgi:hypothetical protein